MHSLRNRQCMFHILLTLLLLCVSFSSFSKSAFAAEETITFVTQPVSMEVNYPRGTEFHVEVDHPDKVASYQWVATDRHHEFALSGSSAKTDTLIVPATRQDDPVMYYKCVVTDVEGNTYESEICTLEVVNKSEFIPVLYVGEFALTPGETMDLSKTALGSGVIRYQSDGSNIDFENVKLDTTNWVYDGDLSISCGLFLFVRDNEIPEHFLHFTGENEIKNTYYDPSYNTSGITFEIYVNNTKSETIPVVHLDGAGSLKLIGGGYSIYSNSDVRISAPLTTEPLESRFNDAITCNNLYISANTKLDLNSMGTGIHANGDVYLEDGAQLNVDFTAPHVSNGPTIKNALFLVGSLHAKNAVIDLKGHATADQFVPYGSALSYFCAVSMMKDGGVYLDHTDLTIQMEAEDSDTLYAINFYGISGTGEENPLVLENASHIKVDINAPGVLGGAGILVGKTLSLDKDSSVDVNVLLGGEVSGIEVGGTLSLTDGNLTSNVISTTKDMVFGVVADSMEITLNEETYRFYSKAENGLAIGASKGETEEAAEGYVKGYTPEKILLNGLAKITVPKKGAISLSSVPAYGEEMSVETVYDPADTASPVQEVEILAVKPTYTGIYISAAAALVLALGTTVYLKKKKEKKEETSAS